jgi:hypothetical protein
MWALQENELAGQVRNAFSTAFIQAALCLTYLRKGALDSALTFFGKQKSVALAPGRSTLWQKLSPKMVQNGSNVFIIRGRLLKTRFAKTLLNSLSIIPMKVFLE